MKSDFAEGLQLVARFRHQPMLGFFQVALLSLFVLSGSAHGEALSLEAAVQEALANNPGGRIARLRVARAEALIGEARSATLPLLRLEASYSLTDQPMLAFGSILNQQSFTPQIDFNQPGVTDNLGLKAEVRHRLFDFGGGSSRTEAARHFSESADWSRTALEAEISLAVVKTAWQIRQSEETVVALEANVSAIEAALEVAQAKFAAGTFLKTEVLNLEVQLAEARENLLQARNTLDLLGEALRNLLGRDGGSAVPAIVLPRDPGEAFLPGELPVSTGQPPRAEILAMRAAVDAAEAALAAARAARLPALDLFGSIQFDHGWETGGSGDSWLAGIRLSWDLFDGHRNASSRAVALADREQAREQLRQQILAIRLEVEQARHNLKRSRETLEVTRKMVEQATEAAQLSRARFEKGVILSSELIDIETRLTGARMRRAVAFAAFHTHLAELRRALGQPILVP